MLTAFTTGKGKGWGGGRGGAGRESVLPVFTLHIFILCDYSVIGCCILFCGCACPRSSGHSFQPFPLRSHVHQTLTMVCWAHVLGQQVSRTRLRGHVACHCPKAGAVCVLVTLWERETCVQR